jgi:hypothetical protein
MIATTSKAKVYYLPAAQRVEPSVPVSRWTVLQRRLLRAWWRVRLSITDGPGVWRRSRWRTGEDYAALLQSVIAEGPAELIERRRPKTTRPAAILDFDAARLRLRPQTS